VGFAQIGWACGAALGRCTRALWPLGSGSIDQCDPPSALRHNILEVLPFFVLLIHALRHQETILRAQPKVSNEGDIWQLMGVTLDVSVPSAPGLQVIVTH
jgi:hypothetical protein